MTNEEGEIFDALMARLNHVEAWLSAIRPSDLMDNPSLIEEVKDLALAVGFFGAIQNPETLPELEARMERADDQVRRRILPEACTIAARLDSFTDETIANRWDDLTQAERSVGIPQLVAFRKAFVDDWLLIAEKFGDEISTVRLRAIRDGLTVGRA